MRPGSDRALNVRVPVGASPGPCRPPRPTARASAQSKSVPILPPPPPEPNPELSPVPGPAAAGAPRLETGTSRTKAFFGARRAVTFSYRVSGDGRQHAQVELVRAATAAVVKTLDAPRPRRRVR